MRVLVTGGAGFIGSAVVRHLIGGTEHEVLVIDKLTYAGNLESLVSVSASARYSFQRRDIIDPKATEDAISSFKPHIIMHLAAESHVDRSIDGPGEFIQTNVVGTFNLLESGLRHWRTLSREDAALFRFHHVSTDEVYGSLGSTGLFREDSPYMPNSPYSASKAASDHLARAWHHTFNFPVVISNCSNNYGPYHFPEKLIPLMIINALEGRPLPVYGKGENVRDWLYVEDHAEALLRVALRGRIGESYNIGGWSERRNIDVVKQICSLLDELVPKASGPRSSLITYVADRPGHDERYAIDSSKIERELGWRPRYDFESGLRRTIEWFLNNRGWWERVRSRGYQGQRLGTVE